MSNIDKKSVDGDTLVRLCNYTDVYYRDTIRPDQSFSTATATPEQIATFRLRSGDVIITKDSETPDDIGVPTYVAASAPDLVCGYHLATIRSNGGAIDGRYLYWAMSSSAIRGQLSAAATGITRYGLRADAIGTVDLPLPNYDEQRAIADFLDVETGRIDATIAKKRRLLGLLDERTSRELNDLFSTVHILSPDGIPVGIPRHHMVRLGRVARVQTGVTLDEKRVVGASAFELPYLRVANVQDGWLDLDEVKIVVVPRTIAVRSLLRPGDVLMTEGGDPDKLGRGMVWRGEVEPCLHQNHVFAVRPDRDQLLPEYLALVTRTSYARRYFQVTASKTTGIASTTTAKIADFRVPLPAIDDQKEILKTYAEAQRHTSLLRSAFERQIRLLQERRGALITAAVTGELEIPGVAA